MRKAEDLIQRFLDSIGQSDGAVYVGLFRAWGAIVGERIAAHAQPVDVRGHSLVIEADHPGWVQMVMMNRQRIVREVGKRFPDLTITGISVRVSEHPGRRERSPDPSHESTPGTTPGYAPNGERAGTPEPPPPSRDEVEALERIEDDDLRQMLNRLRGDLS